MADVRHIAIRYYHISTKNHPILMKVHSSTLRTPWQPDDQIWTFLKFKMPHVRRF